MLEKTDAWAETQVSLALSIIYIGRGGGIRTPDPLLPKQMRYQTALRPDTGHSLFLCPRHQPKRIRLRSALLIVTRLGFGVLAREHAVEMEYRADGKIGYRRGCQPANSATSQTKSASGITKTIVMPTPSRSRNAQSRQVCRCGSAIERVNRR